MKLILVTALAGMLSTVAEACTLSESDFTALAASPSHLTKSEFDALTPTMQRVVCSTRTYIAHVDAQKGVLKDVESYSRKWLTSAENARIVAAGNALVEKKMYRRH
jgi:heme oxygenase